jgi:hypothetical protein
MFTCTHCEVESTDDHTCSNCREPMQCASLRRVGNFLYRCSEDAYHGDPCSHFTGAGIIEVV